MKFLTNWNNWMPKIKTFIQLKYIQRLKEIYLPKKIKPFSRKHCPVLIKSFLDLPPNFCFSKIERNKSIDSNWIFKGQKKQIWEREREREGTWGREWRRDEDNMLLWNPRAIAASLALVLRYKASLTVSWLPLRERERERERAERVSDFETTWGVFCFEFECLTLWLINKLPGAGGSDKITDEFTDLSKI